MGFSVIDPRNRIKKPATPKMSDEAKSKMKAGKERNLKANEEEVRNNKSELIKVQERATNVPKVISQLTKETNAEYAMLLFLCNLPIPQRKPARIMERFNLTRKQFEYTRQKNKWIDRISALDAWNMVQEQNQLEEKQSEHREMEELASKYLYTEAMSRIKNMPDGQLVKMLEMSSKLGRLSLNMPTQHSEVHHKYTLEVVVKKITELAMRHIPPDLADAFRKDIGNELPAIEAEIVG